MAGRQPRQLPEGGAPDNGAPHSLLCRPGLRPCRAALLRQHDSESGFAIGAILFLLTMIGVGGAVLYSGYSQILRTNISITRENAAKNDLIAASRTLSASAALINGGLNLQPPAVLPFGSADSAKLPTNYANSGTSGAPTSVGVMQAGAGTTQLDPWGHYYIYCRWEGLTNPGTDPGILVITAGPDGVLDTKCGDLTAQNDDKIQLLSVAQAIDRANVWQYQTTTGGSEVQFGITGNAVRVTNSGDISANSLTLAGALNAGTLSLTAPLAVNQGGTGSSTAPGARANLGSGAAGDALFTAATAAGARGTLGSTTVGDALFTAGNAGAARTTLGATAVGGSVFTATDALAARAALGAGTTGDALFTAATATGARSTLGATLVGDALFTTADAATARGTLGATAVGGSVFTAGSAAAARSALGSGATGDAVFVAANQTQALTALGLLGGSLTLDVGITGTANTAVYLADGANILAGAVPVAHGGTGATTAATARSNLGADNATNITSGTLSWSRLPTSGVSPGSYNWGTVNSQGIVTAANNVNIIPNTVQGNMGGGSGGGVTITGGSGFGFDNDGGNVDITGGQGGGGYIAGSVNITGGQDSMGTNGSINLTAFPAGAINLNGLVNVNGSSASNRFIAFTTTGLNRWTVGADSTAESGGNAGSNFVVKNYNDAGTLLGTPFTIDRATGNVTINGTVTATTFIGGSGGAGAIALGTSATGTNPARSGELGTGLYTAGSGLVDIAASGSEIARFSSSGIDARAGVFLQAGVQALKLSATGNPVVGSTAMSIASSPLSVAVGRDALASVTGEASSVAVGHRALAAATTATANTAMGYQALQASTTGTENVAVGYQALAANVGGTDATAVGFKALAASTTGDNTAFGAYALTALTTGSRNTSLGDSALPASTTGTSNTAVGTAALNLLAGGASNNTAIGDSALGFSTSAANNTAVGYAANLYNTTGNNNTAIGYWALAQNRAKRESTALGYSAMYYADSTTTGTVTYNTGIGAYALRGSITAANNTGTSNTAVGHSALLANTSGSSNTALGALALTANTTGANNLALGNGVASTILTAGSSNILIGTSSAVDAPTSSTSNWLNIGNTLYGDLSNKRIAIGSGLTTTTAGVTFDLGSVTDSMRLPLGTTAQRPTGAQGMFRYNTQTGSGVPEYYDGTAWQSLLSSATGSGASLTLGASVTGTNPQRSGEAGTGLFSDATGVVAIASLGTEALRVTATGSVGIGTALPSDQLHVYSGTTNAKIDIDGVAAGQSALRFFSAGTEKSVLYRPSGSGDLRIYGTTLGADVVTFNTTTGGIGIGTTTPSTILSFGGGAARTIGVERATSGAGADLTLKAGGAQSGATNTAGGNLTLASGIYTGNGSSGSNIFFQTPTNGASGAADRSPATRMWISGNNGYTCVGSCTDPPSSPLTVGSASAGVTFSEYAGVNTVGTYNSWSSIALNSLGNSVTYGAIRMGIEDNTAAAESGFISFVPRLSGVATEAMRVTSTGSLGIGTVAPSYKLDISSTGGMRIPLGTTAQRPTGAQGVMRYNSTTGAGTLEYYDGTAWQSVASGASASSIALGASATANNPARTGEAGTGLFSGATGQVSVASNGVEVGRFDASGLQLTTATGAYQISGLNALRLTSTGNPILGSTAMSRTAAPLTIGIGRDALTSASTEAYAVAVGHQALALATTATANTAVGYWSLVNTTTGTANTAYGFLSGASNTTGSFNNAIGGAALFANTTGSHNNALGASALVSNTIGSYNIAIGSQALNLNTLGSGNVAIGSTALATATGVSGITAVGYAALSLAQTAATANTAVGYQALTATTTGTNNTAVGYQAMSANTGGYENTGVGASALNANTTGYWNSAFGAGAMLSNTTGIDNSAFGRASLIYNTTGASNSAFGRSSLYLNTVGSNNSAFGDVAMVNSVTGSNNSAFGFSALSALTTGSNNVALGYAVGSTTLTTGSGNILIGGSAVDTPAAGTSNWLNIGNTVYGDTSTKQVAIGSGLTAMTTGIVFDLGSNTNSMRLPVGTTAQRPTGAQGMFRYNSTTGAGVVEYYDGSAWQNIASGSGSSGTLGSSLAAASPAKSGEANTGLYSTATGTVQIGGLGSEVARFVGAASQVNYLQFSGALTTAAPTITAGGTDTNINISLTPKGTGKLNLTTGSYLLAGVNAYSSPTSGSYVIGDSGATAMTGINNLAVGYQALNVTTTGAENVAVGRSAMAANTSGTNNVALGNIALAGNTTANANTAIGYAAMNAVSSGGSNVAVGYNALLSTSTGTNNTAIGTTAMQGNTGGQYNTAIGDSALKAATTSSGQVAIGYQALLAASTSTGNTAIGYQSMKTITTAGHGNTALGYGTLALATSATGNIAIGLNAMAANTTGDANTVIGTDAYKTAQTASGITAIGYQALSVAQSTATANTAIGYQTLAATTTGVSNTAIGYQALASNLTGYGNVGVGDSALATVTGRINNTAVGSGAAQYGNVGSNNTALGAGALNSYYNVPSDDNTAVGSLALQDTGGGGGNTAVGSSAMQQPGTISSANVAVGFASLQYTKGSNNNAVGYRALRSTATANNNNAFGYIAGYSITTGSNNLALGDSVASTTLATGSNNILIGTSSAVDTPAAGTSNWLNIGNTVYGDTSTKQVAIGSGLTTMTSGIVFDLGSNTNSMRIPVGTTAQRPTGAQGMLRYNTQTGAGTPEYYDGSAWQALGASGGATIVLGASATANNPQHSGDATTGLFSATAGTVSVAAAGTEMLRATATALIVDGNTAISNRYIRTTDANNLSLGGSNGVGLVVGYDNKVSVGDSASQAQSQLEVISGTFTDFRINSGNVSKWTFATDYSTDSNLYLNRTAGTGNFVFNTGYNVGIGTTTPGQKLTVSGRIESQGGMLFNQGAAATDNLIYLRATNSGAVDGSLGFFAAGVGSTSGSDGPYFLSRGNNFSAIANQRGNFYFAAGEPSSPGAAEGSINFMTGASGVNKLTMLGSGNVGIGTASPAYKLDIVSTGGMRIPVGTTAQRPTGAQGVIRYNTTTGAGTPEYYDGSAWQSLGASGGGGGTIDSLSDAITDYATAFNMFLGSSSGSSVTTGANNTALGYQTLAATTTGSGNTALGSQALLSNTVGASNSAVGSFALFSNNTGYSNTTVGNASLFFNTTGFGNTAMGVAALYGNTTGTRNTAIGNDALQSTTTGSNNTALGAGAGNVVTTGVRNLLLGTDVASVTLATGSNNIVIGTSNSVDTPTASTSNWLNIGNTVYGDLGNHRIALGNGITTTTAGVTFDLGSVTDSMRLPKGTTAQRPTGAQGMLRYNTQTGAGTPEYYDGSGWQALGASGGGTIVLGASTTANNPQLSGDAATGLFSPAASTVAIATAGVERLRVDGSGNIAVGTDTPTGDSSGTYLHLHNPATGGGVGPEIHLTNGNTGGYGGQGFSMELYGGDFFLGTSESNRTINFYTQDVPRMTVESSGDVDIWNNLGFGSVPTVSLDLSVRTDAVALPKGSTAQRPTGAQGMLRYNTTTGAGVVEYYDGSAWQTVGTGSGGSGSTLGSSLAAASPAKSGEANTGLYSTATGTVQIGGLGSEVARFVGAASQVNYLQFSGALTTAAPTITAGGTDTNINISLTPKGTGKLNLTTGSYLLAGNNALAAPVNTSLVVGNSGGTAMTGTDNVAVGYQALNATTTGTGNVAIGKGALASNVNGSGAVAIGAGALGSNTLGGNTAIGDGAMSYNNGYTNVAVGGNALGAGSGGATDNTAVGFAALMYTTTGNANAAVGRNALSANTGGSDNAALGANALAANTTGQGNVGIGSSTLLTAATATGNTAVGYQALKATTTGTSNTVLGYGAGDAVTTGSYNVAVGLDALGAATTPSGQVAIGYQALLAASTSTGNTAIGYQSMKTITTAGHGNTALGYGTLALATSATGNIAIGLNAMAANTTGDANTVIGTDAYKTAQTASGITAIGYQALSVAQSTATGNTAVGYQALAATTTGDNNTAVGYAALLANTTGAANAAFGTGALGTNTSGYWNTALGIGAGYNNTTARSMTALGYSAAAFGSGDVDEVTAIGSNALRSIASTGSTALGAYAGYSATTGHITALGHYSLNANTTGDYNLGVGPYTLQSTTTGSYNTAVGVSAGNANLSGSNNTFLGYSVASTTLTTGSSNILIGTSSAVTTPAAGTSNWLNIGNTVYGDTSTKQVAIGSGLTAMTNGVVFDLGSNTNSMRLPKGTTAQRPTGAQGMVRYNTTTGAGTPEYYDGSSWQSLGAGGGGGASDINGLSDAITDYATDHNMFMGSGSGASIAVGGQYNLTIGESAGAALSTGDQNVGVGFQVLAATTIGSGNTALGYKALVLTSTGNWNTAVGSDSMSANTSGYSNAAFGEWSLHFNTVGYENTGLGTESLHSNTGGNNNTAVGNQALGTNTTGNLNTGVGDHALSATTTGAANTALGSSAGASITVGSNNTILGYGVASSTLTTGSNNILIGTSSAVTTPAAGTNKWINIGGQFVSDWSTTGSETIGLNRNTTGTAGTTALLVGTGANNGNGALLTAGGVWTNASDRRIKEDIQPLGYGLDTVMRLKPVAYKMKDTHVPQIGFIAQDVETVLPEVVVRPANLDDPSQHYTMSYGNMVAVAVKAIQELKAENDNLRAQVVALQQQAGVASKPVVAEPTRSGPTEPWLIVLAGGGIVLLLGLGGVGMMVFRLRREMRGLRKVA